MLAQSWEQQLAAGVRRQLIAAGAMGWYMEQHPVLASGWLGRAGPRSRATARAVSQQSCRAGARAEWMHEGHHRRTEESVV